MNSLLIVGALAAGVYFLTRKAGPTFESLVKARAEEYVRNIILAPQGWENPGLMASNPVRTPDGQLTVSVSVLSGGIPGGPSVYWVNFSDDGYPIGI